MDTLLTSPFMVLLLIGFAFLALTNRGPYRHEPQIMYIPVESYERRPNGCLWMVLGAALALLVVALLLGMLAP